jgi:hypothetical protein
MRLDPRTTGEFITGYLPPMSLPPIGVHARTLAPISPHVWFLKLGTV